MHIKQQYVYIANNVSAVFLHNRVHPHTQACVCMCVDVHGCAGRLQKRCLSPYLGQTISRTSSTKGMER